MSDYRFLPCGDSALTVEFSDKISEGANRRLRLFSNKLKDEKIRGIIGCVSAFCCATVYYDPLVISEKKLTRKIAAIISSLSTAAEKTKRVFIIPVCYEPPFSPDLDDVCRHNSLSAEQVISLHTAPDYLIYMLGFLPGFAYLGGLDERIATPRLDVPRTSIPQGAVGIGNNQTGIYPLASPGGWRLIGSTPVKPYDPNRKNPILYQAGDYIRFKRIDKAEYEKIKALAESENYLPEIQEVSE